MGKKRNTWSGPWGIALIFLIIIPFIPSPASSEEIYKFKRMWPTLQQPWYFNRLDGIAVDSSGNFYVADTGNHYIQKYTPEGQFITKWGGEGTGDGFFIAPYGIAVDSSDFVYVVDGGYAPRIQKFSSDGRFITVWGREGSGDGEFDLPQGIAADSGGFIYVTEANNNRVQKFTSDGQFVTKWGITGSGEGEFDWPEGIAVDKDGFVYVADQGNHRVQKFTPDGQFITEWGRDDYFGFFSPHGVATDADGNIYVAFLYEIGKFTSDGQLLSDWGEQGTGDGQFLHAMSMAVDRKGNVYVTDWTSERIQKFTADGRFITKYGPSGSNSGEFAHPTGIAIDSGGNVYVVDEHNHRIQKFTLDGQFISEWGSEGNGDGEFKEPEGIAVDSNGNVYVADQWNYRIQKFTPDGQFLGKWELEFPPYGIAVGSSGDAYVADGLGSRVLKFTSDGQFIREWGSPGIGDGEFGLPYDVAVDSDGNVYVADGESFMVDGSEGRIQKFTPDGQFITKWGSKGTCDGNFTLPQGIAVDNSGYVYVTDGSVFVSNSHRIQKFTSDGEFITKWGIKGSTPGRMNGPRSVAVAPSGDVYVTECEGNHRVQVFKRVTIASNTKAIIVAGGGAYPGNNLWDATQMCANFAYRTLTYQGFTKESIYYLSSDTDLDLDENGVLDDVDADATSSNLEYAITQWAADADSLVLYVVDHGGDTTFRMSSTETLSASALDSWLEKLQQTMPSKVTVIYDACESGSFVSSLTPPAGKQRVVITSTSPSESAYFVTQGSVSFSNYFWTHIFNGLNVKEAFDLAKEALGQTTAYQTPLLDDNGTGTADDPGDGVLAQNTFIGNGTVIHGTAPTVGSVSSDQPIANSALLYAENVTDTDGVAQVWAVIRPPNYNQGSADNPVQELPSLDLASVGSNRYEATYHGFNVSGTYQIAIYARDRIGNTSVPKLTTVTVDNPLKRKAIIVAGGSQSDPLWPAIEKTATLVYQALAFQGYTDSDIYFMSPVTFSGGVDGLATSSNLSSAINNWAQQSTQDVVLYLVGKGDHGTFELSGTQTLLAADLDGWLDNLQENLPGKVTVIYDGPRAGSFLPLLTPPQDKERILLASTGVNQPAYFLSAGDISFSKFFWRKVLNGANVRDSFLHAKRAIAYACRGQTPNIDDNGNGIGNEKLDGQLARYYTIGVGIMLAGDDPVIGSISPEQTLDGETSATIWVEGVTTTGTIDRVWAVITPPGYSPGSPSQTVTDTPTVQLNLAGNGRYEGIYNDFSTFGTYEIAVYAMDADDNISLPKESTVSQTVGSDSYEEDDTYSEANVIVINDIQAQVHTFHDAGDQDWVMFYALAEQIYTIEASNLGTNCDVVIQLYSTDGTTLITEEDSGLEGEEEFLIWDFPADGLYYVKVKQYESTVFGEDTEYDLKVYVPIGPLPGFVTGGVTNAYSGKPVAGARIKTDGKATALSLPDGNYLMVHPPGTYTLTAEADGHQSFSDGVTIGEAGTVTKNISMVPFDRKGDLNRDDRIDLADTIIALKVLAGMDTSGLIRSDYAGSGADVDGNSRIGLAEALFVLQHVAGLRQ